MKKIIDYFNFSEHSEKNKERKYRMLYLKDRNKLEERGSIEGGGKWFIWSIVFLVLLATVVTLIEVYF